MVSISSCRPCRRAKAFLNDHGVEFNYLDMDKADEGDWDLALDLIGDSLPSLGIQMILPIIIIDGVKIIHGYDEEALIESLHI